MARKRYQGGASGGGEDINVTPLMDIVFIMLIFFIVTSTFVKEPGVDVVRPKASTAELRRLASILVAVTPDNEIWINKKKIEPDQVRATVEALRQENPKGTAVIQVDAGADSRFLVEVANQIRDAGVDDIAVSTDEAGS
jgi:biopolymer transport protein ExbD